LFDLLGIPVASLSGSMVAVAVLAMAGFPVQLPPWLRDFGLMTAGLSLGSTITAEALATIQRYPVSLLGLALTVFVTVAASKAILERRFGWDRATAFLAAVPGALSMVMALAVETAADVKRVAVAQAVRLFTLVAILPLAVSATGAAVTLREQTVVSPPGMAVLYGATFATIAVMTALRFAKPTFLGGLVAGAAFHVSNLVPGGFPSGLAWGSMVLVGIVSGLRFMGARPREVLNIFVPAVIVLIVAMCTSAIGAVAIHVVTGLRLAEILVAFAPGGVEAMVLIGAGLGLDTLLIATHHVARAVGLNMVAPLFAPRSPPV